MTRLLCEDGTALGVESGGSLLLEDANTGTVTFTWVETSPGTYHFTGDFTP